MTKSSKPFQKLPKTSPSLFIYYYLTDNGRTLLIKELWRLCFHKLILFIEIGM